MSTRTLRLAGVELYFDDLDAAKRFYEGVLGLKIVDEQPGHHAQFASGSSFVCLERKGVEAYPSRDKAVLFFEVSNLERTIAAVGSKRVVESAASSNKRTAWAVLHDPEGHSILLLEKRTARSKR